MNGKTIGRTKPQPDFTRVEEGVAIHDTVAESLATGVAYPESEKPTTNERGLRAQVVLLQRRVDQAEARASVLMNGGDRSNLSRPSGNASINQMAAGIAEAEAFCLPEVANALMREFDKMLADVKAIEERKAAYARDVELDAADFAAKRKAGKL